MNLDELRIKIKRWWLHSITNLTLRLAVAEYRRFEAERRAVQAERDFQKKLAVLQKKEAKLVSQVERLRASHDAAMEAAAFYMEQCL